MIAVDTNVLVRYVTNDEPEQARRALRLLDRADGVFVGKTVLLELEWVLRAAYGLSPEAIDTALRTVVGLPTVVVEDAAEVAQALDAFRRGLDFADALHVAAGQSGAVFHTFDQRLVQRGRSLKLRVSSPPR